jgi:hypothetical protein
LLKNYGGIEALYNQEVSIINGKHSSAIKPYNKDTALTEYSEEKRRVMTQNFVDDQGTGLSAKCPSPTEFDQDNIPDLYDLIKLSQETQESIYRQQQLTRNANNASQQDLTAQVKKLLDSEHILSTVEEEMYSQYSDFTHRKILQTESSVSRFSLRNSI